VLNFVLQRDDQNALRTLGTLSCGDFVCQTLELPWENNAPDKSCIPANTYICQLEFSPDHNQKVFWLQGTQPRKAVEIHWGNFVKDTKGCILLGTKREANAIDNSVSAFDAFMAFVGTEDHITLQIIDPPNASV
jgi:hypothetical protein